MPNLVGIGNSQVPTNAMLGGLAYQDSIGNIDIEKIKARTSDTAKDVFVYDTRKDSDGGAWRHRTQNTSWYNEGVSEKRGARKEFPAVVVIVCVSNHIKIYDGDDPNLPLWMDVRATKSRRDYGWMYGSTLNAVTALNGIIAIAANWNIGDEGGLLLMDFVKDELRRHESSGSRTGGELTISQRETAANLNTIGNDLRLIVDPYVNDVAMTVLPNAPIDISTELPIPTIAVATNGGLSVIKDDGTVVNKAVTNADTDIANIDFTNDGNLLLTRNNYNYVVVTKIGSANDSRAFPSQYSSNINYFRANGTDFPPPYSPAGDGEISGYLLSNLITSTKGTDLASADTYGLNLFSIDRNLPSTSSSVAYITKDFNTGYQHGDIKGAFLSSIDDTDITATSLTSNWATVGNWTYQSQKLTLASDGAGGLNLTHADQSGSYVYAFLPFTVEANTDYIIYVEMTAYHSSGLFVHTTMYAVGGSTLANLHGISGTFKSVQFNSGSNTTLYLHFNHNSTTATNIKNVVAQKVTDGASDRSVNAKDLLTFGTITRTHVATGAELVAYNGFSTSNYLFQPYNSDLQFGTGDYSIMLWYKGVSGSTGKREIFAEVTGSSASFWLLHKEYTNKFVFDSVTNPDTYSEDVWYHVAGVRESGISRLYVNGELVGSAATGDNITDTSLGLIIGQDSANNDWRTRGSLALLKISASSPSADQIKKIYDDEKCLYHENAKCTIHGTSDAVTGLAFDDTNNVLHVGTSAGRSEFQGLNRINNTTTAVTTAISVSNEFVAEQ